MTELSERLRASDGMTVTWVTDSATGERGPSIHADKDLLTSAADEIERLTKALEKFSSCDSCGAKLK